ncbi:hypothetical protein CYQ88_01950 [Hydrogenovibrio sp. SC-1]|uniref:HvfA family oxazolone/thioamide-modified RiPP metallophore n=1 Tax=Hydrogenovibrio sp. SC-1 TaxID=2065820 RepID=UPI000C799F72|nr:twin-arginine translocation signal domain-containing protein [Hydrogenovibrio sp. SC-1]PLA75354.1 hypothetical protein CYQ88_01950 [Hydrogenovibrio sp. SC-1]
MKNTSRRQFLKLAGATTASVISGSALANEADFGFKNLERGYENSLASSHEGKCGEGKCGEGMKMKKSEGKCGGKKSSEGKCGEGMKMKKSEGKCGGKKSSEGKCGGRS